MKQRGGCWRVSVTAEGLNISRLLGQAGERGIHLTHVQQTSGKKAVFRVRARDLSLLEEMIQRGGWRLQMGQRYGWGQVDAALRRRWLLTAAALAAGIALLICSRMVWRISIEAAGAYAPDVAAVLEAAGVRVPCLRNRVNLHEIQAELEWRYPEVAWVECGWRGTSLVIRLVKGEVHMQQKAEPGSSDVIASRDGVISSVVTVAGTPVVKPGDVVRAGEVLIRGEERASGGETVPVHAEGTVKARVWRSASVTMPLSETITTYTGNTQLVWTIETPWFDLWKLPKCDFAVYDTQVSKLHFGGIFIPTGLRVEKRLEAELSGAMRDRQDVQADAERAARCRLQEKLAPDESLIDIWGNCSMIDDETLLSVVTGEVLVDIGVTSHESGMAAPE